MGCDRISELPDCLLTHILSTLPTKISITTSVLSTRWRNLWLNVTGLDLELKEFPVNKEIFASFIDRFMEFNNGSRLQKLKMKNNHNKIFAYCIISMELIATAVDRGIQHLDVEGMSIQYLTAFMPMNIYKSKTLVSLKLVYVVLENPKIVVVSLPCLKIMHLENFSYGYNSNDRGPLNVEKLISGCPVLEDLTLVRICYTDMRTLPLLCVRSHTLKIFRLMFDLGTPTKYSSVEIDCPRLKYMSFKDTQSDRIVVKNLSSLFKIDLDTEFNVKDGGSPLEPNSLMKRDMIHGFFTGISNVQYMIISQPTLKIIYRYSMMGQNIPNFHNLSHLQASFSSSSLQHLLVFLESCPNLRNLILDLSVSTEEPKIIGRTNVPRCLTSTLECVEINKLIMWEGTGIKLVQYFLDNSAVLMKLNLSFTDPSFLYLKLGFGLKFMFYLKLGFGLIT